MGGAILIMENSMLMRAALKVKQRDVRRSLPRSADDGPYNDGECDSHEPECNDTRRAGWVRVYSCQGARYKYYRPKTREEPLTSRARPHPEGYNRNEGEYQGDGDPQVFPPQPLSSVLYKEPENGGQDGEAIEDSNYHYFPSRVSLLGIGSCV